MEIMCSRCADLGIVVTSNNLYVIARTIPGYHGYDFYNQRGKLIKYHEDMAQKDIGYIEFYLCDKGHYTHKIFIKPYGTDYFRN